MKLPTKYMLPVMILTAVFVAGCVGYHATKTTAPTIQETENLVYLDLPLKLWIPCDSLTAEELSSGRTKVTARFANKENRTAECQVQVRFKDAAGKVIDETGWMPFLLPRRELSTFEHTSLVTGVKSFTLLLRKAKS